MIRADAIVLAPMEGVADAAMREVLTRIGGYDWCVSEFARVSVQAMTSQRLHVLCPELARGGRTVAGTPVRVQLLGSDPALMAESAAVAAALDPFGVDLNFGCPAPIVNRRRGGAALLDEPELLYAIAVSARAAVPAAQTLSAKMRLGIARPDRAVECAQALAAGGIDELVVHARTRDDGYRAPARWELIAPIREALDIPVIANGDIWTADDGRRCREITACSAVMLGRGAISDPFLARRLRGEAADELPWRDVVPALVHFWLAITSTLHADQQAGRLKQWLGQLRRNWPEAALLFATIRELRQPAQVATALRRHALDCGLAEAALLADAA